MLYFTMLYHGCRKSQLNTAFCVGLLYALFHNGLPYGCIKKANCVMRGLNLGRWVSMQIIYPRCY